MVSVVLVLTVLVGYFGARISGRAHTEARIAPMLRALEELRRDVEGLQRAQAPAVVRLGAPAAEEHLMGEGRGGARIAQELHQEHAGDDAPTSTAPATRREGSERPPVADDEGDRETPDGETVLLCRVDLPPALLESSTRRRGAR